MAAAWTYFNEVAVCIDRGWISVARIVTVIEHALAQKRELGMVTAELIHRRVIELDDADQPRRAEPSPTLLAQDGRSSDADAQEPTRDH
jgi:hypothetical protein